MPNKTIKIKIVKKVFGLKAISSTPFFKKLKHKTLYFKRLQKKKKKVKKQKKKHTNFFKAINWIIFKFDFVQLLGRTYYLRKFLFWLLLDIILFVSIPFVEIKLSLLNILLMIPVTILSIKSVVDVIRNSYYSVKCNNFKSTIEEEPRVNFASGGPGCGKSSLSAFTVVVRAKMMWQKLKLKAFMYQHKNYNKLSEKKKKEYDEVMYSYKFYINHPDRIPCLWSNIPIQDYHGRKSFKLKKAHLFQKLKLPLYSVIFVDEIGLMFKAKKGSCDFLDPVSEFARFVRHYIDGCMYFTEQEINKAFVDLRRVSGSNKWLYQQKWIMKPTKLINIKNSILSLVTYHLAMAMLYKKDTSQYAYHMKKSKKTAKRWSWLINFLNRYIYAVGWRRYECQELGNCESGTGLNNVRGFIFIPSSLNCRYDDRAYRNKYAAKDLPIEDSKFESLTLTQEDLDEIFGKLEEEKEKKN